MTGFHRRHNVEAGMALSATIYNFDIELADSDRHVYESLALRVARHPSESEDYLVARVLAYALEYTEGIGFSRGGVSDAEEPAIVIRDLTGAITTWIEIGATDPDRLHKAAKTAPRVVVYLHRDPAQFMKQTALAKIHRAESLELYAFDRGLIRALVSRLERRIAFSLSVVDRELYVSIGTDNLSGRVLSLTA
jgi:uncharacterized protein YaeQ